MALEGTIKEFGLADIFQLIGLQNKTGVLFLKGETDTVNVFFEDGKVVKVDESKRRPHLYLGQILVRKGRVKQVQVRDALDSQKNTGQKIGNALISQGLINKDHLRDALTFQMTEAVYRVFRWKGGDYKFDQERVDFDRDTIIPISTEHILMDGVRQLDEWPQIEKKMPDMAVVFRRKDGLVLPSESSAEESDKDIFASGGDYNITPDVESLLKLVDGHKTILEVVEGASLGEFDACRIIVEVIDAGLIQKSMDKPESFVQETVETETPEIPIKRKSASETPSYLSLLTYAIILFSVLILVTQLTGTRKIMDVSQSGIESLKDSFALNIIKKNEHASYVFLFDHDMYPDTPRNLERSGYLSEADQMDPWGNPVAIKHTESGDLYTVSPGPDRVMGSPDDITSDYLPND